MGQAWCSGKNECHYDKTKIEGELEHAWKDEPLEVVSYNLKVFTIVWRAHCKHICLSKNFNDQIMDVYQECGLLDIQAGHWGRQYAAAKSHNSHRYGR